MEIAVAPAVISAVRRDKTPRLYLAEVEIHRRGFRSSAGSTPSATAIRKRESKVGFAAPRSISLIRARRLSARSAKSAWVIRSESLNLRTFRPSAALRRLWALAKDSDFATAPPGILRVPRPKIQSDVKDGGLNPATARAHRLPPSVRDQGFIFLPNANGVRGFGIISRIWTDLRSINLFGRRARASSTIRARPRASSRRVAAQRLAFPLESLDQRAAAGEG
jgi:hypothetical protein